MLLIFSVLTLFLTRFCLPILGPIKCDLGIGIVRMQLLCRQLSGFSALKVEDRKRFGLSELGTEQKKLILET